MKKLTAKEQKWLKKNKRKKNLPEISQYLELSPEETKKLLGIREQANTSQAHEKYILIALLFVAFLIFATSLPNQFLSDDFAGIPQNPLISQWTHVFNGGGGVPHNFVYTVLVKLFGLVPWPFRLASIIFHLTTTAFLFLTVRRNHSFATAITCILLFVIAPVIVEPVIWVSGMAYVLGGMFAMMTIYLHLDDKRFAKTNYLEMITWVLCVATSEKYFFIPIVLLLWDWYKDRLRLTTWLFVGLFLVSLIRGLSLLSMLDGRITSLSQNYYSDTAIQRPNPITKPLVAIGFYLQLYFWPKALTLYQSEVNLGWDQVLRYGSVTILFFLIAWWQSQKTKDIWLWMALGVFSMIPVLLPMNISSLVAERYAYLFYAGSAVTLSIIINRNFSTKTIYILIGLVVIAMAIRTLIRIQDWRDADTLWFSAAPYSPSSFQNHNNLGDAYVNKGDYQKAIEEFTKGIQINPRYADAMHNRANVYWRLGDMQKAKEGYLEAFSNNPKLWQSLIKISEIEANQGNWQIAIETMKKAYELNSSPAIAGWVQMLDEKAKQYQYNKK